MKSTYEAKAPDGSILHVASKRVHTAKARMMISCQRGACWYGDAVRETDDPSYPSPPPNTKAMWVDAERVAQDGK